MSTNGYLAMAVVDLALLLAGSFVIAWRLPEHRDWDFEARACRMSIRFKVKHNGYSRHASLS
jgi:hypothetical protein